MTKNPNLERCALVLKLNPLEPNTIVFCRTLAPWWSCYKSTLLLVMNLKLSMKVVTKLKTLLFSLSLQFPALDTIIGCAIRFIDCLPIASRLPSSYHSTCSWFPTIMNYHYSIAQDLTYTCSSLLSLFMI